MFSFSRFREYTEINPGIGGGSVLPHARLTKEGKIECLEEEQPAG
jgi:hypothetical protein